VASAEKQPSPWLRVPLESIGFPGFSNLLLDAGASMLSVHFIDARHVLVAFDKRGLVTRLKDDPEDDQDHIVQAEIVELPEKPGALARVIARDDWRMHDHGRYLWSLGQGDFLVREGAMLYTISPRSALAAHADSPLLRAVASGQAERPAAVTVSANGGLLTTETLYSRQTHSGQTVILLGDTESSAAAQAGSRAVIRFFRIQHGGADGVRLVPAGRIGAPELMYLPVDEDGFLWASPADNSLWHVTFDSFAGKTTDLGMIDSSCQPRLEMLDRSEFLAFTCRGNDESIKLASYGFDAHETWEEPVGDFGTPTLAYAPVAARFAVNHVIAAIPPNQAGQAGSPAEQEVRVYQNASGDLLLRAACSPIEKTGENFDLLEDGRQVVVVRDDALVFYRLPPLSARDREDMAAVAKFAPPPVSSGPVLLTRITTPVVAPAATGAAAAAPAVAEQNDALLRQTAEGPEQDTSPVQRKPPTLLKPGEKPEFGAVGDSHPESPTPPAAPPPL
jgi:hypothetical protein